MITTIKLCEQCPTPVSCLEAGCSKKHINSTISNHAYTGENEKPTLKAGSQAKDTNPKGIRSRHKVAPHLVPEIAVIELAEAFRDGALKYGPFNWRKDPVAATVYLDAAERHMMLYRAGQDTASDSGLSHLTHAMSNFAILLDAALNGTLIDDRNPSPGLAERLEEKLEEYKDKAETRHGS